MLDKCGHGSKCNNTKCNRIPTQQSIQKLFIAAAASEPEANERGSSLISRNLHYRGLQSLFLTKCKGLWLCASGRFRMCSGMRKKLWLCASGRFRMHSSMPQGIVVMHEWEDLGCAVM